MTQVITRLFADHQTARRAEGQFRFFGFPRNIYRTLTADDAATADALVDKLTRAGVQEATAKAYAAKMTPESALLIVSAGYKPLGVAKKTREILDRLTSVKVGKHPEENWIPTPPNRAPSILKDHPRLLTLPEELENPRGPISRDLGVRLLSEPRNRTSAMTNGGRRMSKMFWPMPLLKSKGKASSAISGGKHMSRMFWPMPLLSTKTRRNSVIRGGALPMSRLFGLPTVSRRT